MMSIKREYEKIMAEICFFLKIMLLYFAISGVTKMFNGKFTFLSEKIKNKKLRLNKILPYVLAFSMAFGSNSKQDDEELKTEDYMTNVYYAYEDNEDPEIVDEIADVKNFVIEEDLVVNDIPEFYRDQLLENFAPDTYLSTIFQLEIDVNNGNDLSWLKSCGELGLKINFVEPVGFEVMETIGSLPGLCSLEVSCLNNYTFQNDEEYMKFHEVYNGDPRYKLIKNLVKNEGEIEATVVNDNPINADTLGFIEQASNLVFLKLDGFKFDKNTDLSWLINCTSLQNLIINLNFDDYHDFSFLLDIIRKMPNLKNIFVTTNMEYLADEDIEFLNEVTSVIGDKLFTLKGQSGYKLTFQYSNVGGKYVFKNGMYNKIKYQKLNKLDVLDFSDNGIYQAAMYLHSGDLMDLDERQVEIVVDEDHTVQDLRRIVANLDSVVQRKLDLNNNDTDLDKINKVLKFIVENFYYDVDFSSKTYDKYYKNGYLYGIFYNQSGIICGNYAAMVNALLYRLGIDAYMIVSGTHAWNLVELNDDYFYLDACWIDENVYNDSFLTQLEIDDEPEAIKDNYVWYFVSPDEANTVDEAGHHDEMIYPYWIDYTADYSLIRKK